MKTEYNKIPDWTGHLLTNGAFLAYAEDVVKVYATKGFDNLALQTLGPQLQQAVNRFAPFVNRKRSYSGTETVTTLDATRDALWKSLYHAWRYLMQTDKSCSLHAAALALKPVMDAYRGLDRHELAKETKEINGLQRAGGCARTFGASLTPVYVLPPLRGLRRRRSGRLRAESRQAA